MARKKKSRIREIPAPKIIREFVETKFSEAGGSMKIAQDYSKPMEEEKEELSESRFEARLVEGGADKIAPVIKSDDQSPLEAIAEEAKPQEEVKAPEKNSSYDMPDYSSSPYEPRRKRDPENINLRRGDGMDFSRGVMDSMMGTQDSKDEYIDLRRANEEANLPFENRKRRINI